MRLAERLSITSFQVPCDPHCTRLAGHMLVCTGNDELVLGHNVLPVDPKETFAVVVNVCRPLVCQTSVIYCKITQLLQ